MNAAKEKYQIENEKKQLEELETQQKKQKLKLESKSETMEEDEV